MTVKTEAVSRVRQTNRQRSLELMAERMRELGLRVLTPPPGDPETEFQGQEITAVWLDEASTLGADFEAVWNANVRDLYEP